jgi:hypothetical protein
MNSEPHFAQRYLFPTTFAIVQNPPLEVKLLNVPEVTPIIKAIIKTVKAPCDDYDTTFIF